MSAETEWMSSTDVAAAAGIEKRQIYLAVDDGKLPAYRIGRYYRFKRVEVEAWLRGDDPPPPPTYPDDLTTEAVARYVTGDDAETVAVSLGLSPVMAGKVEEWAAQAGHRVR